jgi:hypothetical protein
MSLWQTGRIGKFFADDDLHLGSSLFTRFRNSPRAFHVSAELATTSGKSSGRKLWMQLERE